MADPEEVLRDFLSRGLRWFETGRAEVAKARDPEMVAQAYRQELARRRDAAVAANSAAVTRYQNKLERSKSTTWTAGSVALASAGLGTVDVLTLGAQAGGVIPGSPGLWYVGAAICAVIAARAARWRKTATGPAQLALPVVPPPILPASAVGSTEAAELVRYETALWTMIPTLTQLHPQAGDELRRSVQNSQESLYHLVERLAVLNGLDGDVAAPAEALRARLAEGVGAYRRLLNAGAVMLGAPDMDGPAAESLEVAAENMAAYTAGLEAVQKTFPTPPGRRHSGGGGEG